ncbi:MAG: guanylate kinase [Chloroflexota bacterium]
MAADPPPASLPPSPEPTDVHSPAPAAGKRGLLFVLSAPSGAGKDALLAELRPEQFSIQRVVSYTTRPPRPGETDGTDYHFVDVATMHAMQAAGKLVECTEFIPGRLYGTPRQAVDEALAAGRDVLIKPEVLGAAKVKLAYPDAIMIFLAPPSPDEATRRMEARGSENAADTRARIAAMDREFAAVHRYDYVVINATGKLDEAVAKVKEIIAGKRAQASEVSPPGLVPPP